MSDRLRILLLVAVVLFGVQAVRMIHRRKLKLGYSLLWMVVGLIMLIAALFPELVARLSKLAGIELPVNMVLTVFAGLSTMMMFYLTSIISRESAKTRSLVQQIGLLEQRIRELEKETKEHRHAD